MAEAVAIDLMKYFTGAEVQAKLAAANKTIPAPTGAMMDPDVQALPTLRGFGSSLNLGVPMANTPFASAHQQRQECGENVNPGRKPDHVNQRYAGRHAE